MQEKETGPKPPPPLWNRENIDFKGSVPQECQKKVKLSPEQIPVYAIEKDLSKKKTVFKGKITR